jgi:hypothetical protein
MVRSVPSSNGTSLHLSWTVVVTSPREQLSRHQPAARSSWRRRDT